MPDVPLDASITGSATVTSGFTPIRALVAAVAGLATITSGFTPDRALASTADGHATITSGFTPIRQLTTTVAGHATVADVLTPGRGLSTTVTGHATITANLPETHWVTVNISAFSVMGVYPPDVVHHFPLPNLPASKIPKVVAVPNPPPQHHVTIQANRAPVQTGPTSQIRVKK